MHCLILSVLVVLCSAKFVVIVDPQYRYEYSVWTWGVGVFCVVCQERAGRGRLIEHLTRQLYQGEIIQM